MKKQLAVLEKEAEYLKSNNKVKAVLLNGSVAYGTATEQSDLDLIIICDVDKFESEYVDDVLVERHYHKYKTLLKMLESNAVEVYKYLYAKTIFDDGNFEQLIKKSKKIYENYLTPENEIKAIQYWLSSTKIKLLSAIDSDEKRVSFLLSTNTWKVFEGVWAKNNKPMPPSSLAFYKHNELANYPYDNWFDDLITGTNLTRANAMIKIIDWLCS